VNEWREEVADRDPQPRAAVVEVPLLFESGMEAVFDHTIAVVAAEDVRRERAAARGQTDLDSRDAAQLSQNEKAERADYIVRNDRDIADLQQELLTLLEKMGL
jgi:dephospho-CoA kinase